MKAPELTPCVHCAQPPHEYMAQVFVGGKIPVAYECVNRACPSNWPIRYEPVYEAIALWNKSQTIHPAVLAALPEVQVMLAAKLEEAAKLIEPTDPGCGCVDCAQCEMFAEGIRALITPDMTAALEARDARIRREERERTAEIANLHGKARKPALDSYDQGQIDAAKQIAAAIRADGEGEFIEEDTK